MYVEEFGFCFGDCMRWRFIIDLWIFEEGNFVECFLFCKVVWDLNKDVFKLFFNWLRLRCKLFVLYLVLVRDMLLLLLGMNMFE